jgi:hypothetical protein
MTRPEAMVLVREMYGDGRNGWGVTDLQRYLERHGVEVSWWTVKKWIDPEYAERERQRQRVKARHALRVKRATPIYRLRILDEPALMDRMRSLRAAELSVAAVAKVLNLDHDLGVTEHEIRNALESGAAPRAFRGAETRRAVAA